MTSLLPVISDTRDQRTRYLVRHMISEPRLPVLRGNLGIAYGTVDMSAHTGVDFPLWRTLDREAAAGTSIAEAVRFDFVEQSAARPETGPGVDFAAVIQRNIDRTLRRLFVLAKEESFQDGVESNLSVGLATLIDRYPFQTIAVLRNILSNVSVSIFVLAEILQVFGWLADERSKEFRFAFLVSHLRHDSPVVRDAAACALACMNDARAKAYLEAAIEREQLASLRGDLKGVLQQLDS